MVKYRSLQSVKKSQPDNLKLHLFIYRLTDKFQREWKVLCSSFLGSYIYIITSKPDRYSLFKWFTHGTPTHSDLIRVSRPQKLCSAFPANPSCHVTRHNCPPLGTCKVWLRPYGTFSSLLIFLFISNKELMNENFPHKQLDDGPRHLK